MTRPKICLYILGENVSVEMSTEAVDHLQSHADRLGMPSVSALVQSLAVCAAFPLAPREAAVVAKMRYARWLPVVALAATDYSELAGQLARARSAMRPAAGVTR